MACDHIWTGYNMIMSGPHKRDPFMVGSHLTDILTEGMFSSLHTPSESNRSLISQAKIEGHSPLY